jgi:hypothetical protein
MYYNLEYLRPLGFKHSKHDSKTIHTWLNVQIDMLFLDLFDENGGSWWFPRRKDKENYALVIKQVILMFLHLSNDGRHSYALTALNSDINTGPVTDQTMLAGESSLNVWIKETRIKAHTFDIPEDRQPRVQKRSSDRTWPSLIFFLVESLPLFKKIIEITQFGRRAKSQLERKPFSAFSNHAGTHLLLTASRYDPGILISTPKCSRGPASPYHSPTRLHAR